MNKLRLDWDRRISVDYRLWMSDGINSDEEMLATGGRDLDILLPKEKDENTKTFLEIGCGVGRLLYHACQRYGKVIGVDVSNVALELAKKFLKSFQNFELYENDGASLPEHLTNTVDIVCSFATLFSIPAHCFCNYLVHSNRVLKNNGLLVFQLYVGEEILPSEDDTLSLRSYLERNLVKTLDEAGFRVLEIVDLKDFPVETFLKELKTRAVVVKCVKERPSNPSVAKLLKALCNSNFGGSSDKIYELSMYYDFFKRLIEKKLFTKAEEVGNILKTLAGETGYTSIIGDIDKLLAAVEETRIVLSTNEDISFKQMNGVVVPFFQGLPLANVKDPEKFELNLAKHVKKRKVVVYGSGVGKLLKHLTSKGHEVFCLEPLEDLRLLYGDLPVEFVDFERLNTISDYDLVINPCYLLLFQEEIQKVKEAFSCQQVYKPFTVAIVSPIDGGSYPISRYLSTAFKQLKYRTLFFDFAHFRQAREASNFYYLDDFKKNKFMEDISRICSTTVVEACRLEKPQILIALSQAPLLPDALETLRKEGIVTAMWFVEDFRRFTYWNNFAGYYDYFFVIQKEPALSEIKKVCKNVLYLPVACDPSVHKLVELTPDESKKYQADISFVGYGYPNRVHTFSRLANYNIKIWGKMWPAVKPFNRIATDCLLPPEEYIKIFAATKINLNLHSSTEKDFIEPSGDFVNPRTFEIAAVGAFQLCDRRLLLPEIFQDKIQTFSSFNEMKEKIDYFLAHPEERKELADSTQKLVLERHTYLHRALELMCKILARDAARLESGLKACKWNRLFENLDPDSREYEIFRLAFLSQTPFDFDAIMSSHLLGKKDAYSKEELKLLFLYHCNRSSKRFIKYA
ncbi:MAG: glycosyltransferase [Deltaproteobacteria bacterium]|nr:glycosyltransferase [Deltaproteobacteria bacterium]MCX7952141.1 glycosyltransferase [Deltaproteobacteria bacterium]